VRPGFAKRQSLRAGVAPEKQKTRLLGAGLPAGRRAGAHLPADLVVTSAGWAARRRCRGHRADPVIPLMAAYLAMSGIAGLGSSRRLGGGAAALGRGGAGRPLGEGRARQRESKAGGEK